MGDLDQQNLGENIRSARLSARLTQASLAEAAKVRRVQIVRFEAGRTVPRLDESLRLAEALKVPLQWLVAGRWSPPLDLKGISLELHRMGIQDLEVAGCQVPGAFRHGEEVLVIAVSGDRPEPRVLEAIPLVLARRRFRPALARAFAAVHDTRATHRLAWLSEITAALSRLSSFPGAVAWEGQLRDFVDAADKPSEPDSLGHPATGSLPPIWRRWNITYAGTLQDFLRRVVEAAAAYRPSTITPEGEP